MSWFSQCFKYHFSSSGILLITKINNLKVLNSTFVVGAKAKVTKPDGKYELIYKGLSSVSHTVTCPW